MTMYNCMGSCEEEEEGCGLALHQEGKAAWEEGEDGEPSSCYEKLRQQVIKPQLFVSILQQQQVGVNTDQEKQDPN